ncbi:MAG: hypothetical protein QHJ81_02895 [Anaerolineae bacterium]|nr:hypothetical protein [Anaerolineae bacterium]
MARRRSGKRRDVSQYILWGLSLVVALSMVLAYVMKPPSQATRPTPTLPPSPTPTSVLPTPTPTATPLAPAPSPVPRPEPSETLQSALPSGPPPATAVVIAQRATLKPENVIFRPDIAVSAESARIPS